MWSDQRKTSVWSRVSSAVPLRCSRPVFLSDAQEGAELAEGNGEEAEQQIQEEAGDDQQEEQDEY